MEAGEVDTLCGLFVDFDGVYPLAVALVDVVILFEHRDELCLLDVVHSCYFGGNHVEEGARLNEERSDSYQRPFRQSLGIVYGVVEQH